MGCRGVLATSFAIEATHSIAMLTFELSMAFGFVIGQTAASFLVTLVSRLVLDAAGCPHP